METPERSTVFSPEMVEVADDEERKADARKRREYDRLMSCDNTACMYCKIMWYQGFIFFGGGGGSSS